jgi:hypothetical protein
MSNLAKLEEKYGFSAAEPTPVPEAPATHDPTTDDDIPLTHWRQSQPVVALSAFLKEYSDQGFHLERTINNEPVLNFDPGLKSDPDRLSLAMHAEELLCEARSDLGSLLGAGLVSLNPDRYEMWR